MPKGNIWMDRCGDQLGTIQFELTNVSASGGPDFPLLTIRADIALNPYIERGKQPASLHPLSLVRTKGQLRSPDHRIVARFEEDIALLANDQHRANTTQVPFEIPLEMRTVHRMETERGSGNLKVNLAFQPLFALHGSNGSLSFHGGRVDGLVFEIPRSQWIDTLLPGLGYAGLEVLEIRYGNGLIAQQLPKSIQEIQEAKKWVLEGHWEKSAVHCRKALEVILDSRPNSIPATSKFRDRVSAFITDNLKVDDAEAKLLAGQIQLIWETASPAAHPSPAHTFRRADAEFILRTTMALVEYFSRLL